MADDQMPAPVAEFPDVQIGSLAELEMLILVMDSPERWWDAESAAQKLTVSAAVAQRMLDGFAARNLLDIRITGDVRYRFAPGSPQLMESVRLFSDFYRRMPAAVVRRIARGAPRGIRDFADAFRIRSRDRR